MLNGQKDISITNLDNLSYGSNRESLTGIEKDSRYHFLQADITDIEMLRRMVSQADAVVNFAAETHVDRSISNPRPFFATNLQGTWNLLETVRLASARVKFVQIGTDEAYGEISKGSFVESDSLSPASPYAATKAAADLLCQSYFKTYGLDVVITRCTNNYGPYQFPEKLIPKTIIRSRLGLKVPIYGNGQNIRDWIYVSDHCRAIEVVLLNGKSGEVYNISGGNEYSNLQLVSMILELVNKPRELIEFVEDRPAHDARYSLNCDKIRRELGWRQQSDFGKSLAYTISWYLENEKWWRPIANTPVLHPTPWKVAW